MTDLTLQRIFILSAQTAHVIADPLAGKPGVCDWSAELLDGDVEPVYLDDEFYAPDADEPEKGHSFHVGELPF